MTRDIAHKLAAWKQSPRRKPLVLRGARQVGKTHALKTFGKSAYPDLAYFNFEEDARLGDFFSGRLDAREILSRLEIYREKKISPHDTLVVLDEIQASPLALNSLKSFCETANDYHIVAAGSLLGIKMKGDFSFPVGKVNFLAVHPLSFMEFLAAIEKIALRELLLQKRDFEPLPLAFHEDLLDLVRLYLVIGGMPEAVFHYAETRNLAAVRDIQREILDAYLLDFAKHAPTRDLPRISAVWEAVPAQLAKENRKFIFSAIRSGARSREYETAIEWLVDAGLAHKAVHVAKPELPLSGYGEHEIFKLYHLDVGLLGAMAGLPVRAVIEKDRLFTEFKGALVENLVAQELIAYHEAHLWYWTSTGIAEVDFLLSTEDGIYPLEVKAGNAVRSKGLRVYGDRYQAPALSRVSALNFKQDGGIGNYPLYAAACFPSLSMKKRS